MSSYLEFSTEYGKKIRRDGLIDGFAVHDGQLPPRAQPLLGVRVDGQPVEFVDETMPEQIHRAVVERSRMPRNYLDCLAFVALMAGALPVRQRYWRYPDIVVGRGNSFVAAADTPEQPVDIGRMCLDQEVQFTHSLYPAHTFEGPLYVQKLGKGPIVLSGLDTAQALYRSPEAFPIVSITAE
jgi:hypothetical protein